MNFARDALRIVVLSGPIGAGKSALAERLIERYGARIIKTRDLIRAQLPHVKEERAALQRAGEKLDRADGGNWVKNALVRFIEDNVGGPAATGFFVVEFSAHSRPSERDPRGVWHRGAPHPFGRFR